MQQFQFQDINVSVTPTNDARQWYMTVEQVAEAYGKEPNSITQTIGRHTDEIREGFERGVTICHTLGGPQQHTVLYRDGVIKLGFFIRGPRAAAFRQFATNLVVQHMQQVGQDSPAGFDQLLSTLHTIQKTCEDTQMQVKSLAGVAETVFGDDKDGIMDLVQQVARMYGVDGRTVWGWVQTECDVGSYKKQNMKVKNFLLNKLGKGIRLVKEGSPT